MFAVHLPLEAGESLSSFAQRHCTANAVARMRDLLQLLGKVDGRTVSDVRLVARHPPLLRRLEELTGSTHLSLDHLRRIEIHGATGIFLGQGHHVCAEFVRYGPYQALCPKRLRRDAYARNGWEFTQAPVCPMHAVALLESCPSCGHHIRYDRTALAHCARCSCPLSRQAGDPVPADAARAAAYIQVPRTLALGHTTHSIPVDIDETSDLLRLCLLPRLGEPADFGLFGKPWTYSVARRVEALTLLGSTMSGRHIDSARLRSLLLRRWPFASLFPAAYRNIMLVRGCRAIGLAPDVRDMLCFDTDEGWAREAAAIYGAHIPCLTSLDEVASFLDVDDALLSWLMGEENIDGSLEEGHGFDMDQVLKLRRSLSSLLSLPQVDTILGFSGLAAELVRAGLLQVASNRQGPVGIHLSHLAVLFDRIQSRVQAPAEEAAQRASLPSAPSADFDAARLALIIAQVVGGSLQVLGWSPPYRVTGLIVDRSRLSALLRWPDTEAERTWPATSEGRCAVEPDGCREAGANCR